MNEEEYEEEYLEDESYYTDDKRDEMRLKELDAMFDNPLKQVDELVKQAKEIQEKYDGNRD